MARLFITGTDTGVGKTTYTTSLIRSWRKQGIQGMGLKPFATGDREDARKIQEAVEGDLSLDEINPSVFQKPLSPFMAAAAEMKEVPYEEVLLHTKSYAERFSHVAIEGAGGWLVPLTSEKMISDFAQDLGYPVVIVARGGLGTLNHVLLTVESVKSRGLDIDHIVLNSFLEESIDMIKGNAEFLRLKTGIEVIVGI